MAFGRTLVCNNDGNYKGPLMLSLNKGSLLVMRGNNADMARHVTCQSPTRRISVTFFKVRMDDTGENKVMTV
ncbi:putative alpha-ketoglutarate-dependent dioxygenase AlkB-like superfamily [Helianthus annuus]|nr:putative alpha-ketoglutarate-dependent dioxygenase AlkB-like superfamily [Helianthus annuus]